MAGGERGPAAEKAGREQREASGEVLDRMVRDASARRCLEPPAILALPGAIYRYMLEAERRKNMTDRAVAADAQPAPVMPAAVGAGAALVGTCALLLARAVSDVPPS